MGTGCHDEGRERRHDEGVKKERERMGGERAASQGEQFVVVRVKGVLVFLSGRIFEAMAKEEKKEHAYGKETEGRWVREA